MPRHRKPLPQTLFAATSEPDTHSYSGAKSDKDFLELWLAQYHGHTRRKYASIANAFIQFVAKPLRKTSVSDLHSFLLLYQRHKVSTQRTYTMVLKSMFAYAQRIQYLRANVAMAIRPPKAPNTLAQRLLTEPEVLALIKATKKIRDRLILKLLYATGIRISELCTLTWEALRTDTHGGILEVVGKGKKIRYVRIPAELAAELLQLSETRKGPMFVSQKRNPLSPNAVRHMLAKAAAKAKLDKKVTPHWLRHTAATHALRRGIDVTKVASALGHSSLAVTSRYLHENAAVCMGTHMFLWNPKEPTT